MTGRRYDETKEADEIEISLSMVRAGVLAFSEFDCRYEPEEVAVVRIFSAMAAEGSLRAVPASEMAFALAPYRK